MDKDKYKVKISTEASHETKKGIYKKYIIAGIIILSIIIGTIIYFYRDNKYKEAINYINNHEYDKAYKILEDLGGSKATKKLKENKYARAKEYLEKDDQVSAIILFNEIKGYEDSKKLIDEIVKEKEYLKVFVSEINDEVIIGEYEQDNNLENGKEPIEWIIIDKDDDKYTLISKYVLDVKKYGYEDKYDQLVYWIKSNFAQNSFNEKELKIIYDVKLLSSYDVNHAVSNGFNANYLKTNLTNYALSKEIYKIYTNDGIYTWWLEDKDAYSDAKQYYTNTDTPYYVNTGLSKMSCGRAVMNGVRPVIILSKDGIYIIKENSINSDKLEEIETKSSTSSQSSSSSSRTRDNSYNGYSYEERKNQCSKTWGNSWRCTIQKRYNCTGIGYSGYSGC